jgi:hypothetical protein
MWAALTSKRNSVSSDSTTGRTHADTAATAAAILRRKSERDPTLALYPVSLMYTQKRQSMDVKDSVWAPEHNAEVDSFIFQQDGARAHFGSTVRTAMDSWYCDRWIGRGRSTNWSSQIPALTTMDFFFWGCIRERECTMEGRNLFTICAEGLQRPWLKFLWICSLWYGLKWNLVSTTAGPLMELILNFAKS